MWPFAPTRKQKLQEAWQHGKTYAASAGGLAAGAIVAGRIIDVMETKKLKKFQEEQAEELRQRDATSLGMQRTALQNQIATAKMLDELVSKISPTPPSP